MSMILGLTGDVGAGKSTISRVWREMGAEVFDADSTAKNLWFREDIQKEAEKRWGEGFFSCEESELLKKLADKIFNCDEEYEFASELLHEATIEELKNKALNSSAELVIVEIPLLFECGRPEWIEGVIYVSAPVEKRAERNKSRGWDCEELTRREEHLIPREEKMASADWILVNSGSCEEWIEQGRTMGKSFLKLASERAKA